MEGPDDRTKAWLCSFTPDMVINIGNFVRQRSAAALSDEVERYRRATGFGPPMLTILDLPDSITGEDIRDLQTGLTIIVRDALSAKWGKEQIRLMLQRGAGIPTDYADKLAGELMTPDTNVIGLYDSIAAYIPNIPLVGEALRGVLGAGVHAISAANAFFSERNKGADTLFEFLMIGQTMRKLGKRAVLNDMQKYLTDYSTAAMAAQALEEKVKAGAGESASIAAKLLPVIVRAIAARRGLRSMGGGAEGGFALPAGPDRLLGPMEGGALLDEQGDIGDGEYGGLMEAYQNALNGMHVTTTPYDGYELTHPETGGFFSALKNIAKAVVPTIGHLALGPGFDQAMSIASKALPLASSLASSALRGIASPGPVTPHHLLQQPDYIEPDMVAGQIALEEARHFQESGRRPITVAGRALAAVPGLRRSRRRGFYLR